MSNPTPETHWACACVKRDTKGRIKYIKLNPNTASQCKACGGTKAAAERTAQSRTVANNLRKL